MIEFCVPAATTLLRRVAAGLTQYVVTWFTLDACHGRHELKDGIDTSICNIIQPRGLGSVQSYLLTVVCTNCQSDTVRVALALSECNTYIRRYFWHRLVRVAQICHKAAILNLFLHKTMADMRLCFCSKCHNKNSGIKATPSCSLFSVLSPARAAI